MFDTSGSLCRAVITHNTELCEKLLNDPNVDCRIVDNMGFTALLYSVLLKHDDLFEKVLNHITRKLRALSLESASSPAIRNELQSYQQLIDFKDPNGRAALHLVVNDVEERTHSATLLLQAKAEVNIRDVEGNTPLHYACMHGHVDLVEVLIKYNANTTAPNVNKQTPLHIAAERVHIRIVSILLQENPALAVRAEDIHGRTALHYAMKSISKDASRNLTNGSPRGTGTYDAMLAREGEEEVVQILLRNGADLYDLDKDGRTPVDFKLYYHMHYSEVRAAVTGFLEYRRLERQLFWSRLLKYVTGLRNHSNVMDKKESDRKYR